MTTATAQACSDDATCDLDVENWPWSLSLRTAQAGPGLMALTVDVETMGLMAHGMAGEARSGGTAQATRQVGEEPGPALRHPRPGPGLPSA